MRRCALAAIAVMSGLVALSAQANPLVTGMQNIGRELADRQSTTLPARGQMEVAFSPDEGAERLVVKVIDSAAKNGEILVLAYSFTSATVTNALLAAIKRGSVVRLVVDHKHNLADDRPGNKARSALSSLRTAGADVRTSQAYAIHHDKVIIVNRKTVQLGSFNYSSSAANKNSENVLVNWDNPDLAAVYLKHFERNYRQAMPLEGRY